MVTQHCCNLSLSDPENKSFKALALSVSSTIKIPSFSRGGIELFEFGAMTDFKMRNQFLEERMPDLSLLAILSLCDCFESPIELITLFLICLNLTQCSLKLVRLAFLNALLRFLICRLISELIHAGSSGLIRVFLLRIMFVI